MIYGKLLELQLREKSGQSFDPTDPSTFNTFLGARHAKKRIGKVTANFNVNPAATILVSGNMFNHSDIPDYLYGGRAITWIAWGQKSKVGKAFNIKNMRYTKSITKYQNGSDIITRKILIKYFMDKGKGGFKSETTKWSLNGGSFTNTAPTQWNGSTLIHLKEWYYHPDWDSLSNVQIDDINLSECGFDINRHPAGDSTYFNKTSRYGYGPIASQICDENKNW